MEIAILLIITLLLLAYTLLPVLQPAATLIQDENPLERQRKILEQEKKNNLQAIKDIDFELATGKISADDHQELRTLFSLKAADAIAAQEQLQDDNND